MIFVGERRSATAQRRNWTWKDGRLAARPLFEALASMRIRPLEQRFVNLWTDEGSTRVPWQRIALLRRCMAERVVIVALGRRVSLELTRQGVDHVQLVHPAARGQIRRRDRYIEHVRERLGPHVERSRPRG